MNRLKALTTNKVVQNLGTITIFVGILRLAALSASILLARCLTETDFGEFTLVRTLIVIIPPLAVWGQNISAARFFSKNELSQYNWHAAFLRAVIGFLILSAIGVGIAVWYYYRFHILYLILLYIPIIAYCTNFFLANIVRSQKKYSVSMFINEGFRLVFLVWILSLIIFGGLNKYTASGGYGGSLIIIAVFALWYTRITLPVGKRPVPREMSQDAIILMVIVASVDIIGNVDRLIIAGRLNLEDLALYAATFAPLQVYMVFNRASRWVLLPVFGDRDKISLWKYTILILIIAVVLTVPFILAGKQILHLLYGGKYDHGASILTILALAQCARLFYAMASSLITGRLKQKALLWHMWVTVAFVIIHVTATYFGVTYFGVKGAAFATLLTQTIRMGCDYFIVFVFRSEWAKGETSPLQVQDNDIS